MTDDEILKALSPLSRKVPRFMRDTNDSLEALCKVFRAGMEAAARECDRNAAIWENTDPAMSIAAETCAAAIREIANLAAPPSP